MPFAGENDLAVASPQAPPEFVSFVFYFTSTELFPFSSFRLRLVLGPGAGKWENFS